MTWGVTAQEACDNFAQIFGGGDSPLAMGTAPGQVVFDVDLGCWRVFDGCQWTTLEPAVPLSEFVTSLPLEFSTCDMCQATTPVGLCEYCGRPVTATETKQHDRNIDIIGGITQTEYNQVKHEWTQRLKQ